MAESKKERILNTFAAHKEHKIEYGSKSDTIMRFAQRTKYNIDVVRKERKIRQARLTFYDILESERAG